MLTQLTTGRFSRVLFAALAIGVAGSAATAKADHQYRYTGVCYNFHGEQHLIDALGHMDGAYLANRHQDRVLETVYAKQQVVAAFREFCDARAKDELLGALQDLNRYLAYRDAIFLDKASSHIADALFAERVVHGQAVGHQGHGGSGNGQQVGFDPHANHGGQRDDDYNWSRNQGVGYGQPSRVTLGGRQFRIGFSF